jgi:hypothetical protein
MGIVSVILESVLGIRERGQAKSAEQA